MFNYVWIRNVVRGCGLGSKLPKETKKLFFHEVYHQELNSVITC
jgi:hypothetical protein